MKLLHIADYGSRTQILSENATEVQIKSIMHSLDWQGFHQIVLEQENGDWLEVGGSLNPDDGLSVAFEENSKQFVIEMPPETINEMTAFLLAYRSREKDWKNKASWN